MTKTEGPAPFKPGTVASSPKRPQSKKSAIDQLHQAIQQVDPEDQKSLNKKVEEITTIVRSDPMIVFATSPAHRQPLLEQLTQTTQPGIPDVVKDSLLKTLVETPLEHLPLANTAIERAYTARLGQKVDAFLKNQQQSDKFDDVIAAEKPDKLLKIDFVIKAFENLSPDDQKVVEDMARKHLFPKELSVNSKPSVDNLSSTPSLGSHRGPYTAAEKLEINVQDKPGDFLQLLLGPKLPAKTEQLKEYLVEHSNMNGPIAEKVGLFIKDVAFELRDRHADKNDRQKFLNTANKVSVIFKPFGENVPLMNKIQESAKAVDVFLPSNEQQGKWRDQFDKLLKEKADDPKRAEHGGYEEAKNDYEAAKNAADARTEKSSAKAIRSAGAGLHRERGLRVVAKDNKESGTRAAENVSEVSVKQIVNKEEYSYQFTEKQTPVRDIEKERKQDGERADKEEPLHLKTLVQGNKKKSGTLFLRDEAGKKAHTNLLNKAEPNISPSRNPPEDSQQPQKSAIHKPPSIPPQLSTAVQEVAYAVKSPASPEKEAVASWKKTTPSPLR